MMRRRTIVVLVSLLVVSTGCEGSLQVEGYDEVLVAPELPEFEQRSQRLDGTQRIFINFDGPVISDCSHYCSDAPNNRSWAIGAHFGKSSIDFAPYTDSTGKQQIINEVKAAFADYDVAVTTSRPSSGPYTMLVVSPTWGPNHGVAPLDCNNTNPNDIGFVYRTGDTSRAFEARAAAHELGHSFGLSHVTGGADYMHWDASGDDFTRSHHDANRAAAKCYSGSVQDAPQMLTDALGTKTGDSGSSTAPPNFYLRNGLGGGGADLAFRYGNGEDIPLSCDWNGDGRDTIAIYRNGEFHLRNSNSGGVADLSFRYGLSTDTPLCGDWNGDGRDTVGIWRSGMFYLRNSNSGGHADLSFRYGTSTDEPIVGDWNGDGKDTIGVRRAGTWHMRNDNSGGVAHYSFTYGRASDTAVVGDWDANGTDTPGVVRDGVFYLSNSHRGGIADATFGYGKSTDVPMTGDWNANGQTTIGIYRD